MSFNNLTVEKTAETPPASIPTQNHTIDVPDNNLPPDLRTDRINDADNILHWSSGGFESKQEETLPGTADLPLTMGSNP